MSRDTQSIPAQAQQFAVAAPFGVLVFVRVFLRLATRCILNVLDLGCIRESGNGGRIHNNSRRCVWG